MSRRAALPALPQRRTHARRRDRATGAARTRPAADRAGARRRHSRREHGAASAASNGSRNRARWSHGGWDARLTAGQVVLAVNAWGAGVAAVPPVDPGLGQRHGPSRNPSRRSGLTELGWTGGESITMPAHRSSTSTSPWRAASRSVPAAACRATTDASVPRSPMTLARRGGGRGLPHPSSRSWPTCA